MKIAWVQLSHTIYFWFEQAAVETTSGVLITTVLQRWSTIQPCFPTLKGFQAVTDHNSHALKGLHSGCTGSNLSSVYVCVIFFQRIPQHRSFTRWHVFTRGDMHSRVLQMPAMTNSPACRRGHSNNPLKCASYAWFPPSYNVSNVRNIVNIGRLRNRHTLPTLRGNMETKLRTLLSCRIIAVKLLFFVVCAEYFLGVLGLKKLSCPTVLIGLSWFLVIL